jgi:pseudaminic acid cytidylyltransferase
MDSLPTCLIPARGGSKRIKAKNVRLFLGEPMIGRTIKTIQKSNIFGRIIVSTEDHEIAEISRNYGADVPFERPANLADDFATTKDVVKHTLEYLKSYNSCPNVLCTIYPIAALITPEILRAAFYYFQKNKFNFLKSAVPFGHPIERAFSISECSIVKYLMPDTLNQRTQDLTPLFHDAGQFYFIKTAKFEECFSNAENKTGAYVLKRWEAVDIDNEDDWLLAEKLATLS